MRLNDQPVKKVYHRSFEDRKKINFMQNQHYTPNYFDEFGDEQEEEMPVLGNIHRYIPRQHRDSEKGRKTNSPQKLNAASNIDDLLTKNMFDLLDKDESNHYSPSSNKSQRHNFSDSGYPESYSNFNSKFQMNRVSHGSLNSKSSRQIGSLAQPNS